jgi:hypothetical protein
LHPSAAPLPNETPLQSKISAIGCKTARLPNPVDPSVNVHEAAEVAEEKEEMNLPAIIKLCRLNLELLFRPKRKLGMAVIWGAPDPRPIINIPRWTP